MTLGGLLPKASLAQRFSLATASIDYYVSLGLLHPIELDDGVFFTTNAIVRIEIIEKGKRLGFSLSEIKRLIDSQVGKNTFVSDADIF